METGVLVPRPGDYRPFRHLYEKWRLEYDKAHQVDPPQNIRHAHDSCWRDRILSIQAAHDCRRPFWRVVRVLFYMADAGWIFGASFLAGGGIMGLRGGIALGAAVVVTGAVARRWGPGIRDRIDLWRFDRARG